MHLNNILKILNMITKNTDFVKLGGLDDKMNEAKSKDSF